MVKARTIARALLDAAEGKGADCEKIAENFLRFAKDHGITLQIPAILDALEREEQRRIEQKAVVITLPPSSEESGLVSRIRACVGAGEEAEERVVRDASLIGGFTARYGGRFYDGSVSGYLERLRKELYVS